MANNSIGGFFVSLGMKVDNSFKAGEEAVSKFIGTAGKLGIALTTAAKVAGAVENSNLKMAKAIGISGSELNTWQNAVSKAGVSASAFTGSMAQLENKMQKLKLGEIDQGLAKSLGMLGIGYDQFANMDAGSRVSAIYDAARAMEDQGKAAALVGDVLGSSGREYYDWLALSGRSLKEELNLQRQLSYTTDETMHKAAAFNAEFNDVMNTTKSLGMLISSKIGEKLTPVAKTVKELLRDNKEFIASGVLGFFDVIGKIGKGIGEVAMTLTGADSIGEAFKKIADGVKQIAGPIIEKSIDLLKDLASVMKSLWDGDWGAAGDAIFKFLSDLGSGLANLITGRDLENTSAEKGEFSKTENSAESKIQQGAAAIASGHEIRGIVEQASGFIDAATGKDARYNAKMALQEKWKAGVNKNFLGIPTTTSLADFDDEFVKQLLVATKLGIYNPLYDFGAATWSDEDKAIFNRIKVDSEMSQTDAFNSSEIRALLNRVKNNRKNKKVDDGIVKPDGSVVQVAPDDWVIAAKDLNNVASAFMPSSVNAMTMNGGSDSYVINQTFSFNGKTDAADVMRQAYAGTQKGLMAAMNKGTQRMQLMPGLR